MSCSKPLPHFTYDLLRFLNREQLERFAIICRPMKKFIDRYFHSKPYRIFDGLRIRGGSYELRQNDVYWHPNRDDYSVQQFLAGQKCSIDEANVPYNATFYLFAEMLSYLGPTVRIKLTTIFVAGDSTYSPDHIAEMESIAYLWRDHNICICNDDDIRIVAEYFLPILNSPTVLQCRTLVMINAHFSFKYYKVLYNVKVIIPNYFGDDDIDSNHWPQFFEQPGAKPIVVLHEFSRVNIDTALDRLKEAFSSAVVPNAFKVVFGQYEQPLPEFQERNKTSGEKLELKKGLRVELNQEDYVEDFDYYTLERFCI